MTLTEILAPVEAELARVDDLLRREVSSSHPFVQSLVLHALQFQGKRIRPAVLLLAARGLGEATDRHIALATVVELIHTATLVHDDILDEAVLRRRVDTLNARWGNEASVLFGDYLFARAFILCGEAGSRPAWGILTRAAQDTCVGELAQIARKFAYDLGEEEYLRIVRRKTGALFAAAGELGADGDADAARGLAEYGLHLGAAFQIVDDCLDIVGEEREMGKSLGSDLAKGKWTLPILRLWQAATPGERAELKAMMEAGDAGGRRRLRERLRSGGALDYAMDQARRQAERAKEALAPLADGPARAHLSQLADYVVSRRS